MKIAIVGAGAIGCLFSGIMKLHGGDVLLFSRRKEAAEYINEHGILVRSPEGDFTVKPRCTSSPSHLGEAEVAVITVKSYETAEVSKILKNNINPECLVLTIQNGLDNVGTLIGFFGRTRVLAGITMQAATLLGMNEVFHAFNGETVIGEPEGGLSQRVEDIKELFSSLGIPCRASGDVMRELWVKSAINSVINPLTALMRCRNGELLSIPNVDTVAESIIDEIVSVARARNVLLNKGELLGLLSSAIAATRLNKSSMLQDIERGRRTEIDYLNGRVVEMASEANLKAPVNALLVTLIRGLEGRQRES